MTDEDVEAIGAELGPAGVIEIAGEHLFFLRLHAREMLLPASLQDQ